MTRIRVLLLLLGALISLAAAASAPTFCKCTCFTNSTIIPLGPQHGGSPPSNNKPPADGDKDGGKDGDANQPDGQQGLSRPRGGVAKRASSSSCAQCNRAFCLQYNLPICQDAEEKDVVTMCFQRDSRKDQIIVWAFILGTAGLLGWAGAQRVVEFREGRKAAGLSGGVASGGGGGGGRGGNSRGQGSGLGSLRSGLDALRSPRDGVGRGDYVAVGGDDEGRSGAG